jgi:hypothetical protein
MMIHPGLKELKQWDSLEYAAGYRARLAAIPNTETAHHCWRCGWEDADTEALESVRHQQVLNEGGEDNYPKTWGLLYDAGGDARANRVPFDDCRTEPWKEGWITAAINMGMTSIEE